MFEWMSKRIEKDHLRKRIEFDNDDEYIKYMFNNFNKRLRFAMNLGFLFGAVFVGGFCFLYFL